MIPSITLGDVAAELVAAGYPKADFTPGSESSTWEEESGGPGWWATADLHPDHSSGARTAMQITLEGPEMIFRVLSCHCCSRVARVDFLESSGECDVFASISWWPGLEEAQDLYSQLWVSMTG
jgi:hypothetical protein